MFCQTEKMLEPERKSLEKGKQFFPVSFITITFSTFSDMASEREAKQLEAATEALGGRVADVKSSLGQLIRKMETDPTLNWHSFLDSYALISGQMNSLLKQMRHEKTPLLRKYITLPLLLSPDR